MIIFHPHEVVARGSETQLQGGEKLNKINLRAGVINVQPWNYCHELKMLDVALTTQITVRCRKYT